MAVLTITFKGQDEVSGAAQQVQHDIAGVGEAADGAKEKGTSFFGGLLQTAGGFLAANVIGGITSQITGFVGSAISSARESNAVMAQTQAVITSTGGAAGYSAQQIADMASSLSAAAGKSLFGDEDIQKGQNLLLTFTNIKETLPDATKTMVDLATAMHTDVAGGAVQLGKALNDPINGISALSRVGVTFTDEQKKQIKTMQDAGNMAGAQKIILAELNKEFGGSAQAAADADGGMAQFKDRLGEVGETLGKAVLPILNGLIKVLLDDVMPVVEELANNAVPALAAAWETIKPVIDVVLGAFGNAGDGAGVLGGQVDDLASIWVALQPVIEGVVNAISDIVQAVFGVVQQFLHDHGDDIKAFLKETWDQIMDIIKIAIGIIKVTIIPALQLVAKFIHDHGDEIQRILGNTWTIIKAIIDTALTIIKGVLKAALQIISGDWSGAWETIKQMFARVWDNIKTIVGTAVDNVKTILSLAWDAIKGKVESAWDGIKSAITGAWDNIKSGVSGKIDELKHTIENLPNGLYDVGVAVVQAIWDGIKAKWQELVDWFNKKLQELKDKLPFSEPKDSSSPLRGLNKAGESIVRNIQQGIQQAAPLAVGAPLVGRSGTGGRGGSIGNLAALGAAGAAVGHVTLSIDDRGLGWLKHLIRIEIQGQTSRDSRGADARQRTR